MTDETPAPVSAALLWSLIERKADEDSTFRHTLMTYVVLQTQSTALAGRLFDTLGLPRDQEHPPGVNPLSMCFDVGVGALESATHEDLTTIFNTIRNALGTVLSANTPPPAPPPDETPP